MGFSGSRDVGYIGICAKGMKRYRKKEALVSGKETGDESGRRSA
jgi:hypothetical protein